MSNKIINLVGVISVLFFFSIVTNSLLAQNKDDKKKIETYRSIGGKEHDSNILGVTIGMDIPTALQTVFANAKRKPGQEKPDAKKNEGKDNKDIRVIYKNLPEGELQIVFAEGKWVKQIVLKYAQPYRYSDLRLPYSADIDNALGGQRYDDRYTLGYTDNQALQAIWWREEKVAEGYKIRIIFTSGNRIKESQFQFQNIEEKAVMIDSKNESIFLKAMQK
jgi:hypothetical protein